MDGYVSMRDVARKAGVTTSTVSLCLRQSPRISAETRQRVLAAAEALGYRPHPLVQSLMRTRRRRGEAALGPALAFVTAFPTRDGWRRDPTPVFGQMFAGARQRAEECGYQLQEFWLHEGNMSSQRFSDMLRARGIHGLILAPLPSPNGVLTLDWKHFAAVALGFTLVHPALHRVCNDHFHSMLVSLEECLSLGHRRIGLALAAAVNEKVQRRWLAAYLLAQEEFPDLAPLEPLVTEEFSEAVFRKWVARERPDAVITSAPRDVLRWLGSRKIGVVTHSVPKLGDTLSGIYQHSEQIGRRSVDLLVPLLERNELGLPDLPDTLLVDGVWNSGKTLAARRRQNQKSINKR